MRIAFVVRATSGRGGMETVYQTVINELIRQGETVKIFIFQGTVDQHWLGGLPYEIIGTRNAGKLRRYYDFTVSYLRAMRAFNPDTIIVSDPNIILFSKIVTRFLKENVPVATWVHFPVTKLRKTGLLKFADYHLAVSKGIADQLKQFTGNNHRNVYVTYNSIEAAGPLIPRSSSAVFLYIGRLDDNSKRISDFLSALSRVKGDYKVIMVGDGDDYPKFAGLAEQLKINGRIEWKGWVYKPWEHVPPVSALVLTSAFEAFGMVLAEAMSRGIPCVSTDSGGPSEIIEHNVNGWLVPVGHIDEIAAKLQQIVDRPLDLPDPLTVQSSIMRFETSTIIEQMRDIFRAEIEKKSKGNPISTWKVVIFDGEKNE